MNSSVLTISMLHLCLFGSPRFTTTSSPPLPKFTKRETALIAYLATQNDEKDRAHLADVFWPGRDRRAALNNLRTLLNRLNSKAPELIIGAEHIEINPSVVEWVDTHHFSQAIKQVSKLWLISKTVRNSLLQELNATLKLYQGPFLESFRLPNAEPFSSWQQRETSRFQQLATNGWIMASEGYSEGGDFDNGIRSIENALIVDPLHEDAWASLLALLARTQQVQWAQQKYYEYTRLLEKELAVLPSEKIQKIYSKLLTNQPIKIPKPARHYGKARHHEPPQTNAVEEEVIQQPHRVVTSPLTVLYGRDHDLNALEKLLLAPHNRLVTLTGFGGLGKTHLAQVLTDKLQLDFDSGAVMIPLAQISASEQSRSATINEIALKALVALELTADINIEATTQLIDYLSNKELLLFFDNFEHLRSAASLVSMILQFTTDTTILVTSREKLNVVGEVIYPLSPLAAPENVTIIAQKNMYPGSPKEKERAENQDNAFQSDLERETASVQLFLESAKRNSILFTPTPEVVHYVREICKLVGGVPLALELAASWTMHFSCEEIAERMAHQVSSLNEATAQRVRDHHSLKAVLDSSIQLLTARAQEALFELTIFTSRFNRKAALAITPVSLNDLVNLVDLSFLKVTEPSIYQLNPLIKAHLICSYLAVKSDIDWEESWEAGAFKLDEGQTKCNLRIYSRARRLRYANYHLTYLSQSQARVGLESYDQGLIRVGQVLLLHHEDVVAAWRVAMHLEQFELLATSLAPLAAHLPAYNTHLAMQQLWTWSIEKIDDYLKSSQVKQPSVEFASTLRSQIILLQEENRCVK